MAQLRRMSHCTVPTRPASRLCLGLVRPAVRHCGGVSRSGVQSGGRMGMVMGEDATEGAPAATDCAENCQAQNQPNGAAVALGFPFPVAPADRLQPRTP